MGERLGDTAVCGSAFPAGGAGAGRVGGRGALGDGAGGTAVSAGAAGGAVTVAGSADVPPALQAARKKKTAMTNTGLETGMRIIFIIITSNLLSLTDCWWKL
ncbi:MAG TPA: hypothetical protein ENK32_03760 [Anaerolineae bacterium]|nr:hypothetical protein [Anaerolineae bacterium]